jgi:hypothetical protein
MKGLPVTLVGENINSRVKELLHRYIHTSS